MGYALGVLQNVPEALANVWGDLVSYLAYAFTITIVVNLASMAVIALTEKIVEAVKGTRIAY